MFSNTLVNPLFINAAACKTANRNGGRLQTQANKYIFAVLMA